MRGIVPAMILMEVEARSGRSISEMFDLIGGASTGAILAAGVCVKDDSGGPKYTPADILQVYEQQGPNIFTEDLFRSITRWFYGSKHSEAPLEKVLEYYFGCSQLQDTLTPLMIPAYNITSGEPVFFKSWVAKDRSLLLKDILRAATAAPTFFTPKRLKIAGKCGVWEDALLYDGALFANNLACCAHADALRMFPDDDIHVLSIGTGHHRVFSDDESPGILPFADTLVQMVYSASEDVVDYQMRKIMTDRYTRIQLTKASQAMFALDDASPRAIQGLKNDARLVIQQQSTSIDRFLALYHQ